MWSTLCFTPRYFVLNLAKSYISSIKKWFAHAGVALFLAAILAAFLAFTFAELRLAHAAMDNATVAGFFFLDFAAYAE